LKRKKDEILKEIKELNEKRMRGMITRYRYYKEYEKIKLELENLKRNE